LNDSHYAAYYSSLRRDNLKLGRHARGHRFEDAGRAWVGDRQGRGSRYEGVSDEKQAREYLRKKRLQKPKDQKQTARIFRQLARAASGRKPFSRS
jgi:regulatory protein